jgi:Domain of unknown function (DUF4410)
MSTERRVLITIIAVFSTQALAARFLFVQGEPTRASWHRQTPTGSPLKNVPVYVTNFELDVLPLPPSHRPPARPNTAAPGAPNIEPPDPAKQASHLVELMAAKLVVALQQAGYTGERLPPGAGRPNKGVQIRGIFAEVDGENHWRRALIRTGEDTGGMEAMVAVANLAKPDQALYEIAALPGNMNRPGAVITFSPYVPLQKYSLNKDADDAAVARVASRIVADVSALLARNAAGLSD